jgi:hypothetical protein
VLRQNLSLEKEIARLNFELNGMVDKEEVFRMQQEVAVAKERVMSMGTGTIVLLRTCSLVQCPLQVLIN